MFFGNLKAETQELELALLVQAFVPALCLPGHQICNTLDWQDHLHILAKR